MTTYKIFSNIEKSFIEILANTNLFYRFEYIEWSGNTYLHIQGFLPQDIDKQLKQLSY